MTDLTEKWKNGELPDGMYYMENTSGIIGMVGHSKVFPCYNVKQILAPVPSYQEYLESESHCAVYSEVNKSLKEKNVKLKELLKEYKKQLSEIKNAYIDLTTQDDYGSYYIDEAKLFVEIVGITIKDYDELELKQDEVLK